MRDGGGLKPCTSIECNKCVKTSMMLLSQERRKRGGGGERRERGTAGRWLSQGNRGPVHRACSEEE